MATSSKAKKSSDEADSRGRVIKKYPNRRLYDTQNSSYITLAQVKQFVIEAQTFVVRDAKTDEDLTRSILLQIILEEEMGGVPMFSEAALANLIRFYGHTMQGFMGSVLEKNMQSFMDMQAKFSPPGLSTGLPKPADLMGGMIEQSQSIAAQMQEHMLSAWGLKPQGNRL